MYTCRYWGQNESVDLAGTIKDSCIQLLPPLLEVWGQLADRNPLGFYTWGQYLNVCPGHFQCHQCTLPGVWQLFWLTLIERPNSTWMVLPLPGTGTWKTSPTFGVLTYRVNSVWLIQSAPRMTSETASSSCVFMTGYYVSSKFQTLRLLIFERLLSKGLMSHITSW